MKSILLITIGLSVLLFADFVKNGDIVTDRTTGLQWQDNADAASVTKTWKEAINYCENLTLGGHDDWRLPNVNELKSTVDRSQVNPAIVGGFVNVSSGGYWSSTARADRENLAWVVYFYYGGVGSNFKVYSFFVRCVRGGLVEAGGEPGDLDTQGGAENVGPNATSNEVAGEGEVTVSSSTSPDPDLGEE